MSALATLLRWFPRRDLLVAAALGDRMGEFAGLVERALDEPDPWHGFCWLVEQICALQAGDRGFTEVLTQAFPGAGEFEELREQSYRRIVELFDRAKDAGALRRDFSPHDFPMMLMANAGVVTATAGLAPADRLPSAGVLHRRRPVAGAADVRADDRGPQPVRARPPIGLDLPARRRDPVVAPSWRGSRRNGGSA